MYEMRESGESLKGQSFSPIFGSDMKLLELRQLKVQIYRSIFGGKHAARANKCVFVLLGCGLISHYIIDFPSAFAQQCLKIKCNIPEKTNVAFLKA